MTWAQYLLLIAAVLHLIEEYLLGDFLGWFRRAIPSLAPVMTPRWAIAINTAFLITVLAAALPPAPAAYVLAIAVLCGFNGLLHLAMSVKTRSWSPGVVTGTLLYMPIALLLLATTYRDGSMALATLVFASASGIALHLVPIVTLRAMLARRAA